MNKEFIGFLKDNSFYKDAFYKDEKITVIITNELIPDLHKDTLVNSEILQWAIQSGNIQLATDLVEHGLRSNNVLNLITDLNLYKKIVKLEDIDLQIIDDAVKNGNIDIVKFLLENKKTDITKCIHTACKSGDLEMFTTLSRYKFKIQDDFLGSAVYSGNLKIIQSLINLGVNYLDPKYIEISVEINKEEVFDYLMSYIISRKHKIDLQKVFETACLLNRVSIVMKMLSMYKELTITQNTLNWLAKKNNIETIHILVKNEKITNENLILMKRCSKIDIKDILDTQ